jgi:hypothetical protein
VILKKDYPEIQARLQAALGESLERVTVQVGDNIHYPGTNIVITAPVFAGLLPEQRFHHVVRALPADLYEALRSDVVWFELAPDESAAAYMRMPRSDDIGGQETAILKRLTGARFFKKFEARLMAKREAPSRLDFVMARQILAEDGMTPDEIVQACLFFIRHGGYSDAQVFSNVMEELAGSHTEQAGSKLKALKKKPRAKTPG